MRIVKHMMDTGLKHLSQFSGRNKNHYKAGRTDVEPMNLLAYSLSAFCLKKHKIC